MNQQSIKTKCTLITFYLIKKFTDSLWLNWEKKTGMQCVRNYIFWSRAQFLSRQLQISRSAKSFGKKGVWIQWRGKMNRCSWPAPGSSPHRGEPVPQTRGISSVSCLTDHARSKALAVTQTSPLLPFSSKPGADWSDSWPGHDPCMPNTVWGETRSLTYSTLSKTRPQLQHTSSTLPVPMIYDVYLGMSSLLTYLVCVNFTRYHKLYT